MIRCSKSPKLLSFQLLITKQTLHLDLVQDFGLVMDIVIPTAIKVPNLFWLANHTYVFVIWLNFNVFLMDVCVMVCKYNTKINSAYGARVIHSMHLCLSGYISDVNERNFMLWGSYKSLSFGLWMTDTQWCRMDIGQNSESFPIFPKLSLYLPTYVPKNTQKYFGSYANRLGFMGPFLFEAKVL